MDATRKQELQKMLKEYQDGRAAMVAAKVPVPDFYDQQITKIELELHSDAINKARDEFQTKLADFAENLHSKLFGELPVENEQYIVKFIDEGCSVQPAKNAPSRSGGGGRGSRNKVRIIITKDGKTSEHDTWVDAAKTAGIWKETASNVNWRKPVQRAAKNGEFGLQMIPIEDEPEKTDESKKSEEKAEQPKEEKSDASKK